VRHVPAELARDLERERETRGRAADVAEVDVDLERQLDLRVLVDEDPDDRACRIGRARDRAHGDVHRLSVPSEREAHLVAGLPPADLTAELGGGLHGHAVGGDDHVLWVDRLRCGDVRRDAGDEDAARRGHDAVAECPQCHDGGDLLGALHVRGVLAVSFLVRRSGRSDVLLRDEPRPIWSRER
jgi:hypothetical protein